MAERIADRIAVKMREIGLTRCCWGDAFLGDDYGIKLRNNHPLNRITAACNAMERAPDLFEKYHIRGMASGGQERIVRGFRLKDNHQ